MSLQTLISTLKQLDPGDPVVLNAALIGSDAIIALLRDGLRAEEITIDAPQFAPAPLEVAERVTIAGSSAFLGVEDIDVVAEFFEDAGALQLQLTASLPAGWMFGDSFPNLAGYLSLDSLHYGYRESYLNVLDFDQPTLLLTSVAHTAIDRRSDLQIAYEPGLNFKANLSLTGLLEPLALISGGQEPLLVTGLLIAPAPVEGQPAAGAPPADGETPAESAAPREFRLSALFPLSLGVDAFQFKNPKINLYSGFADQPAPAASADDSSATPGDEPLEETVDAGAAAASRIEVSAELSIAGRNVELFAGTPLGTPLDFIAIGARTDLALPSLGDIAALVGDADLEGALPDSLQSFGGLKIEQFITGFSIAQRALDYLTIDVSSADSWTIIPDVFEIESLFVHWLLSAPLSATQRRMFCAIDGQLKIADVKLAIHAELPEFLISGALAEGSTIKLGQLLAHFIPGIPAADDHLMISRLNLLANPKLKTFTIETTIENVWPIPLGFTDLEIKALSLALDYAPQSKNVNLAGQLRLLAIDWSIAATYQSTSVAPTTPGGRPASNSSWIFAGQLADGEKVRLPDLVDEVITQATGDTIELPDSLAGVALTDLAFNIDTGAAKEYGFQGAFGWDFDAAGVQLSARAGVKIRSWLPDGTPTPAPSGARKYAGAVSGAVSFENIDVDFFKNFAVSVIYTFSPVSKALSFNLKKNGLDVTATFEQVPAPGQPGLNHSILTVDFGKSTFGDLLTFMAQLVDPSIDEFTLDPPWDELNKIDLDNLILKINLTTKAATIGVPINQTFFGGLVEIQRFDLNYVRLPDGKKTVTIGLVGGLMGDRHSDSNPKSWDALNQPPPAVAGKGSAIFDLDYLGLGQHVAFRSVAGLDNITKVMTALRAAVVDLPTPNTNPLAVTGELLQFDAASGWLIGAQFTVIGTVSLAVIFNDPLIYGVRIELAGAKAKIFAGLAFEILYRRISDTIGVYHIELVLPEVMRQLEFGAVSVTLPVIVVDIYTNGDFKLDFGFPWRGDFARSFAVDAFPFTGAGGFYFNKLSAATATSVPAISTAIGVFNPVIEFGLGLKIGLGKTFNKGVLKAELSITVLGVLEGVIAWFNPSGAAGSTDQYYMIKGGVAIVGRLWGMVDFEIVQVEIEVLARAMVVFKVEAYRPIYITLSVEVSVRASIKILFIRIHFSFSLSISQSFEIGSRSTAPWELPAPAQARMGFAAVLSDSEPPALHWVPAKLWETAQAIDIYFQPAFTRDASGVQGLALLFIENGIPLDARGPADMSAATGDQARDFDVLALALLEWAIRAHTAIDPAAITLPKLEQLHDLLVAGQDDPAQRFDFANLSAFLGQNFVFRITDRPIDGAHDVSGTIFPIFPQLTMRAGDHAPVPFATTNTLSAGARQGFADYFATLRASHGNTVERGTDSAIVPAAASGDVLSAATFMFVDYFALLTRSVAQLAIDHLRDNNLSTIALADLLGALSSGAQLKHLAGMASRFLLHGLRLPWPTNDVTTPLYRLTGQQFSVDPAAADTLTIAFSKPAEPAWITFIDYDDENKATPSSTALGYSLAPGLANLIRGLSTAQPQLDLTALRPLPFYAPAPRHFTIEHKTEWQATLAAAQHDAQIFDLPDALRGYLAATGSADLTLQHGAPAAGSAELKPADIQPLVNYDWATRVRLTVRRVPAPGGAAMLPQTYLLIGADEPGKDLLEDLWTHLQRVPGAQARPYLLYTSKANGGLTNRMPAASLLLKTNLSTQSNPAGQMLLGDAPDAPADDYAATLDDGANFIRLVWECSTVSSGGFYLNYAEDDTAGLPEDAFADGLSASLELLVLLDRPPLGAPAVAYSFQNSLISWDQLNLAGGVLFAQSTDSINVLSVPAGHVGFRLERDMPPAPDAAPDAANELNRAYQLLGYRLQASAGFHASGEGLPVGPAPDDPSSTADDGKWIYERMAPVYRFADVIAPAQAGLPAPEANPYAGIRLLGAEPNRAAASAAIEFFWQDVYGNRLQPSGTVQALQVRYFDPLLGINQWPTVAESYWFAQSADPNNVVLKIELAFDTIPYTAAGRSAKELGQKISAARAIYERVYYQIHQPDVTFAIHTTVLPTARRVLDHVAPETQQLIGFVDAAYRYLNALEQAQPATPPAGVTIAVELSKAENGALKYPDPPIFPVTAQIDMRRDPALIDPSVDVPEAQTITAFLKPRTAANDDDQIASLRPFAAAFEQAFDELRLAVGSDQPHKHSERVDTPDAPAAAPLWAVHLGQQGISYNIHEEYPFFFTPAALANTLLTSTVELDSYASGVGLTGAKVKQRVEAIDINVLAHDFLAAVEQFLEPAVVLPARRRRPARVKRILDHKRTLAEAIKNQVTHILAQTDDADISARRAIAADLLHQQLLINLVEAYDIETIIQYNVDVALAHDPGWTRKNAPRLFGQPVVRNVKRTSSDAPIDASLLNFTLSTGKAPLSQGESYLTFFFNTKSPEKFEDLTLDLVYRVNELEHDIVDVAGISDYQASSWLSFVLPIDQLGADTRDPTQNPNYIGEVAIPIPLRTYPIPPSLVLHAAEADPDSLERLQDIRQWQYTYVYEHLDIAQDTIETSVSYNVTTPTANGNGAAARPAAGSNVPAGLQPLFDALVNFAMLYPQLAPALSGLSSGAPADDSAIDVLEALIARVAGAWQAARIVAIPADAVSFAAQYEIDEIATADTTDVTIARMGGTGVIPSVIVPGYRLLQPGTPATSADATVTYSFVKKSPEEAAGDPIYGESSIPDRKLTFPDRDIVEQQNAWGAIWLTRNKELAPGRRTNPVFVYQTPQVRFTNMVTPLLVNTRPWQIDEIDSADGQPQPRSLAAHIELLFATLFPASATQAYDIRLTCRYAFALAVGGDDSTDLLSILPVLLGPRFTIAAGAVMLAATEEFRASLVQAIGAWKDRNNPLQTKGMYIFSIAIFSNLGAADNDGNTNLPILRIEDLRLPLRSIS
jgi:hypothetical protein